MTSLFSLTEGEALERELRQLEPARLSGQQATHTHSDWSALRMGIYATDFKAMPSRLRPVGARSRVKRLNDDKSRRCDDEGRRLR